MNYLIDIGHPAHVHLFKNFAWEMAKKGNKVLFTLREKEHEKYLLEKYGFRYKSFGPKYKTTTGKLFGLLKFDLMEYLSAIKFKPDVFLSHGSIYAAHAAFLVNKPHISLEDSGNWEQIKLYLPFTKAVLSPDVIPENLGQKQIRYSGYHELAYLHPNNYNCGNVNVESGKYGIIRLVSWQATHDHGQKGLSKELLYKIVDLLKKEMKVYISSEGELPQELIEYRVKFQPQEIHEILKNAEIVISEGATVASEAGVLGTPTIYINSISRSYCEDEEKYGLVFNFRNGVGVYEKVKEILSMSDRKSKFYERKEKLLNNKIDVSAFLIWFVENYPDSFRIMKENPEYQYYFR